MTAQARKEKVESDKAAEAEKLIVALASDPTPHNRYQIAQLVGYAVNEMTKPATDWLSLIADVKRVGYGDKAAFKIRQEGITAFIQAKGSTTARSKISHKQIMLDTLSVSARPVIHLLELRTGRVQMADLIRDAAYEITTAQIGYIQQVLYDAVTNWATPFYGTGAGIVKGVLHPMLQHWMRTGGVAMLGDVSVISKLAEETGFAASASQQQFSPSIIDQVMSTGLIGTYYGAKVINLVNPYRHDNVTPLINPKMLYVLPTAAAMESRPLKVVYEGDIQSTESTNIDDLAYEVRLDQFFNAAVVFGKTPQMSVYTDTSA